MSQKMKISIVVVCRKPQMNPVLIKIRKWYVEFAQKRYQDIRIKTQRAPDIPCALRMIEGLPQKVVLVLIGYRIEEMSDEIFTTVMKKFPHEIEVIIRPPRPCQRDQVEVDERPSATFLHNPKQFGACIVNVQNTLPAIRKSVIRLKHSSFLRVSKLDNLGSLKSYFHLRYKVWKSLDYIPNGRECSNEQLEVDYTDRCSLPIGAFINEGGVGDKDELIGCGRLVFPLFEENRTFSNILDKFIIPIKDQKLINNIKYPRQMKHPFDILDSFEGFGPYYRELVKRHIPKAEISRCIVAKDNRKEGVGEIILDSLIAVAKKENIKKLFLGCVEKHKAFYEKSGFSEIETLKCEKFVNVNVPAIAMSLDM